MNHLQSALVIPAVIGIQGKAYVSFPQQWGINPEFAGLLLARAYAVTYHKQRVLAVLGILGVCIIVLQVVCPHVHFCHWLHV